MYKIYTNRMNLCIKKGLAKKGARTNLKKNDQNLSQ